MQALRAQSLNTRLQNDNEVKKLEFCCCNDLIAPPMWTLFLTHCPDYLNHLWGLNNEAKLVSLLYNSYLIVQ